MRVIIVGASRLTSTTVNLMLEKNHEVVVIEKEKEKIEKWSEELDCGFVHGDGSRPSILQEVDPKGSDLIIFISSDDTDNILGAVVAKSMKFKKVVLRIEDPDLEPVCDQLELENVLFPDRKIAKELLGFTEEDDSKKK